MNAVDQFISECLAEAKVDYVGLWQIAQTTRERFGAQTTDEARAITLQIVGRLYKKGLRAGNYWGGDFDYWPDEGCQAMLDRIEREWIKVGEDPDLGQSICWFAPRSSSA